MSIPKVVSAAVPTSVSAASVVLPDGSPEVAPDNAKPSRKGRKAAPAAEAGIPAPAAVFLDPRDLTPDPSQPRVDFDTDAMADLIASVKARGVLQPIRVRVGPDGQRLIVSGERRWRAAMQCKLSAIPCVVVDSPMTESQVLEEQLVENCLREDLSPMERARTFQRLINMNGWKLTELARKVSLDKAVVSRSIALLGLPSDVQAQVESGSLPPATAYEISRLKDEAEQRALATRAIKDDLNKSEVHEIVREATPVESRRARRAGPDVPAATTDGPALPEIGEPVVHTPTTKIKVLDGAATIHVVWTGEAPCTVVQALNAALKVAKGT